MGNNDVGLHVAPSCSLKEEVWDGGVLACRAPLRDWSALCCRICNGVRLADTPRCG